MATVFPLATIPESEPIIKLKFLLSRSFDAKEGNPKPE